jgi:hypothetical protein
MLVLRLIEPAEGEIEGQNLLVRDVAPNDITRAAEISGDWVISASYLISLVLSSLKSEYPI